MSTDDNGGDDTKLLVWVAAALFVVGLSSLVIAISWNPPAEAPIASVVRELFVQLWPFTVTASFGLLIYERGLRESFIREMRRISGPPIVKALLPRQVMQSFLSHIYGDHPENRDVATTILGGAGEKPDGNDLTISSGTTVAYGLENASEGQYFLTSTVRYSFKHPVADGRFVLFAMASTVLRDSLTLGCDLPLFDYWYFPSEQQMSKSIDTIKKSAKIKVRYLDVSGTKRESSEFAAPLQEVEQANWADYLRFFRGDMGALRKQNPDRYQHQLKIYSCEFRDRLSEEPYRLDKILGLQFRSSSLQDKNDGYCYWVAPYPCLVEEITFDADNFSPDDDGASWRFRVAPFLLNGHSYPDRWIEAEQIGPLTVGTWVLPGQGVALLWRPVLECPSEETVEDTNTNTSQAMGRQE